MRTTCLLIVLVLAAPAAQAEPAALVSQPASIDELKSAYLACSRAALDSRMSHGDIMRCSLIYEALKQRAFDGDFASLLAWSRAAHAYRSRSQVGARIPRG